MTMMMKKLRILYVVLMFLLCMNSFSIGIESAHEHANSTMASCIERERHALIMFKRGIIVRPEWEDLSSWGSEEEDCCKWEGVECSNLTGHVTSLDLPYVKHISIKMTSSLIELKSLNHLTLSDNDFRNMPIPNYIGSLTSLVYLDLSYSHLSGPIPYQLRNLSNLKVLDLSFNNFVSSPIPDFIGSFTKLEVLRLSRANLNGPIIPYQLGNLSNLKVLDLSENEGLYGNLEWLSRLSSLKELDLSGIDLSRANGWVDIIKALPFLSKLKLRGCNLSRLRAPSSLSSANSSSSISTLYLSFNNFVSNPIPDFIGSFTKLEDLRLSGANLNGPIPYQLGNLSNLKVLDLSQNEGLYGNLEWLSRLSSLKELDLSGIDLSRANGWVDIIKALPFLSNLKLGGCNLSRVLAPSLSSANSSSSISTLVLSSNNLTFSTSRWLFNLSSSLVDLDLSENLFKGSIPDAFGYHLTCLTHLSLEHNLVESVLLKSLGTLCNLISLRLGWNNLNGSLEDFSSGCATKSLEYLDLSNNQLVGAVPVFRECSSLKELYLSNNHLAGPLVDFKGWPSLDLLDLSNNQLVGVVPVFRECPSLEVLILSNNQFSALLPETFGHLLNLRSLDISNNSLEVVITKEHFSNISNLWSLDLSFNTNISFNWSPQHVSPDLQLRELYLRSCKLGPRIPDWIKTQNFLNFLDLSNNEISDSIPTWFWDLTSEMFHLNLSSNKIGGIVPNVNSLIFEIDLSSNYFEGPIPSFLANGTSLNLSRNKFSGNLSFLQAPTRGGLQYLDVSHNYLLGEIPDYWINFKEMKILNFAYNNFSGGIPSSLGFLMQLEVLDLHRNMLSGELPMHLRNCSQLSFLNLGANKFSGHIPAWMGEISMLYTLIMRSNEFFGSIPLQLCQLGNLQFLDLSTNNISGKIPGCFNNFTGMIIRQHGTQSEHFYLHYYLRSALFDTFYDHAPVVWKGGEHEFEKNLEYLKSIDLSSNKLNGELPETIFALKELVSLNISKNDICGNIPREIGNLKSLESLDLSNNRISGGIPASMSFLNFLSYLDLSNNNLSGKIPAGTQLQGFNVSTYMGNSALCGTPLVQKCHGDESSQVPSISTGNENEGKDEFDRWFYIGAALGFSTTFWGICGALILNRRWRHAYFLYLDNLKDWIYVIVKVYVAKLRRI